MKYLILVVAISLVSFSSCRYKQIKGSGNLKTEERSVSRAEKIKLAGSYDVEITQGSVVSVKVEADDNILPFIFTSQDDGYLLIKSKEHVSFSSENPIKIFITTPKIEQIILAGSGNIVGKSKFTNGDKLVLKIAGSGDMQLEVNTPEITAEIAGSGTINLKGETKTETIKISGVGDYNAIDLKAENAKIKIAGSGNVRVFAETNLDISIAGIGSVYYKGAASVKQKIAGSGEVKKMD